MNIFYPLEVLAQYLVHDLFSIANQHLAHTLIFFIEDTLKIFFLIVVITHLMSLLRHYLPIEKIRDFLAANKLFGLDYLLASVFGAITPFCSCSSIPLFVGFLGARIPLGVTFAFLITSPIVNEVAIGLFLATFGLKATIIYVASGLLIGMVGGFILGKLNMEKYVASFIWDIDSRKESLDRVEINITKTELFKKISNEAWGITKQIMLYVVIGVALGAIIHGYVPENFFEVYLAQAGIFGVPLAVILAIPLYSNASAVIPILESLVAKGVPLGTALAFMMATVGLSLPEALILKKVLKLRLLLTFFSVVTVGIIMMGYLFNIIF